MNTINWTPHTKAADTGYVWIEGNVPLTKDGFPEAEYGYLWDPIFGRKIPRPVYDFGHCSYCDSPDGCERCRLRLMLPFWVHNTTLDELVTYKVDLEFWSRDQRWVSLNANSIPLALDGGYHGFAEQGTIPACRVHAQVSPSLSRPNRIRAHGPPEPNLGIRSRSPGTSIFTRISWHPKWYPESGLCLPVLKLQSTPPAWCRMSSRSGSR